MVPIFGWSDLTFPPGSWRTRKSESSRRTRKSESWHELRRNAQWYDMAAMQDFLLEPLPPGILSASLFLCLELLREGNGVHSAIRIVDIWHIPKITPENADVPYIQGHAVGLVKAYPGDDSKHEMLIKLVDPKGNVVEACKPMEVELKCKFGNMAPGGITFNMQISLAVKAFGTLMVLLYLDGRLVAQTPLTILEADPKESVAGETEEA